MHAITIAKLTAPVLLVTLLMAYVGSSSLLHYFYERARRGISFCFIAIVVAIYDAIIYYTQE